MQEAASIKFNIPKTTTYIIMPLAFTGKDKRFRELTNAYQFLLAEIYTANKAVRSYAKLTYEHFVQKFGMSRETVCDGLHKLEELGIIERLGNSRFKILLKFNKSDYIIIDDYLYKKLWNVGGVQKRLARSRIKTLAFLERENLNPKTGGVFRSSQARIGKAINLPRTTAGDCVRDLSAVGVLHLQKSDVHVKEAYKRGLTLYTVDKELLAVKRCKPEPPPDDVQAVKDLFKSPNTKRETEAELAAKWQQTAAEELKAERNLEAVHKQLLQDEGYRALTQRIDDYKAKSISAILQRDTTGQERLEEVAEELRKELIAYLKARCVPSDTFPKGFFYII